MAPLRVGFVGSGKMALALVKGFLKKQGQMPWGNTEILASCPVQDAKLLEPMKALGCDTMHCNKSLLGKSDVVVLAVKPNIVPLVLKDIKDGVDPDRHLITSLAAGVTIGNLESNLKEGAKVIRIMPNTPAIVSEGATVFSRGRNAGKEEATVVDALMSSVGLCREVPEYLIDAVTGVSGSGPAYMYLIIEALADGAVKQGLPRDIAYKLAAQTMVGAGKMVLETGDHPAVLKDEVTSPAGTTIAALDVLEKNGLRSTVMKAVEAATLRCKEMSEKS